MSIKFSFFAAILLSIAGTLPAFASDAYLGGSMLSWVPQGSQVSRAAVRADLIKAEHQGLLQQGNTVYPKVASAPSPTNLTSSTMSVAKASSVPGLYRYQ